MTSQPFFLFAEHVDPHVDEFFSFVQFGCDVGSFRFYEEGSHGLVDYGVVGHFFQFTQSLFHFGEFQFKLLFLR